jgi:MoaA/NifB/PqqE/SkfB family radical SAM enzyme
MSNILTKAKKAALLQINPGFCRPKAARIIITINCNFRCQMCTFWKDKHQDPSLDTIKKWVDELVDFGVEEIDIGGGEPFVRNDLKEIVSYIKSKGMRCGLTTNGSLVTEENLPDIDFGEVSIDGAKPETHDKIRNMPGSWERAFKAADLIKKYCPVHLNFTLQADNYLELGDFFELVKSRGYKASIIPVSLKLAAQPKLQGDLTDYNIPILKQQLKKALATGAVLNNKVFLDIFMKKLEKGPYKHPCYSPSNCILIFVNGDIYPCGNLDETVGNLSEGKIKDIYGKYVEFRKRLWKGDHPFCNQCVYPDISTPATIRASVVPYFKKQILRKD